jgi:hypothetical protein
MILGGGLRAWAQVLGDCKLSSDRTLPDLRFCQNAGYSRGRSRGSVATVAWRRLRALCHHRCCIHPPRYDPHHTQAACCKCLPITKLPGSALRATRDRRQLECLSFQKNGGEGAGVEQTLHYPRQTWRSPARSIGALSNMEDEAAFREHRERDERDAAGDGRGVGLPHCWSRRRGQRGDAVPGMVRAIAPTWASTRAPASPPLRVARVSCAAR